MALVLIPFFALVQYLLLNSFLQQGTHHSRTSFGLTQERVIIVFSAFGMYSSFVHSVRLFRVDRLEIKQQSAGAGTVLLHFSNSPRSRDADGADALLLYDLDDSREVYDRIAQAMAESQRPAQA